MATMRFVMTDGATITFNSKDEGQTRETMGELRDRNCVEIVDVDSGDRVWINRAQVVRVEIT